MSAGCVQLWNSKPQHKSPQISTNGDVSKSSQ